MPRLKNIKPPTKVRVAGMITNMEKKTFHEKEIASAKKEGAKMHLIKYSRFENGIEIVTFHQPVKH